MILTILFFRPSPLSSSLVSSQLKTVLEMSKSGKTKNKYFLGKRSFVDPLFDRKIDLVNFFEVMECWLTGWEAATVQSLWLFSSYVGCIGRYSGRIDIEQRWLSYV